ncbi:MAG: RluA family pseudouridine synthase [Bdellovibrionales bacterium]|nr:RluA family pseudouridine synthase [Bdellovibrionales bacterium]
MEPWIWIWTPAAASSNTSERADVAILRAFQSGLGSFQAGDPSAAPALSRSQLQKMMELGLVTLNGKALSAGGKLIANVEVRLEIPPPKTMELTPEDRPLTILYQDEHLAVINKPPGLTVHPSETQRDGTLVHALLHHIKDLSGIGGVLRPGIVHRLDKDTSGALVISKTDIAHQRLVETFAAHRIERRYWALCYGVWRANGETKLESKIGRNPNDRKKMTTNVKEGRNAITWVRSVETFGTHACWLEARLETGRTHQVRVHLTSAGHSILGDPTYGAPTSKNSKWLALPVAVRNQVRTLPGQALHARILGFDHPVTGEALLFEAEPPDHWKELLSALRKESGNARS